MDDNHKTLVGFSLLTANNIKLKEYFYFNKAVLFDPLLLSQKKMKQNFIFFGILVLLVFWENVSNKQKLLSLDFHQTENKSLDISDSQYIL